MAFSHIFLYFPFIRRMSSEFPPGAWSISEAQRHHAARRGRGRHFWGNMWNHYGIDQLYHVVVPSIVIVDQHGIIMVIRIMPNYNWNDYQSVILNQILDHYQLNMI